MDLKGRPLWAIGDVHGCAEMLYRLIHRIREEGPPEPFFVFLGDYAGRGPSSKAVLEGLMNFVDLGLGVALEGNHDRTLLDMYESRKERKTPMDIIGKGWHILYGKSILQSYGIEDYDQLPTLVVNFLRHQLRHRVTIEEWSFQHGDQCLGTGPQETLVCGHHYVPDVRFEPKSIFLDTGCYIPTGKLSAVECRSRQVIQVTHQEIYGATKDG